MYEQLIFAEYNRTLRFNRFPLLCRPIGNIIASGLSGTLAGTPRDQSMFGNRRK